jgi:hypothetical protein
MKLISASEPPSPDPVRKVSRFWLKGAQRERSHAQKLASSMASTHPLRRVLDAFRDRSGVWRALLEVVSALVSLSLFLGAPRRTPSKVIAQRAILIPRAVGERAGN